MSTKLRGAILAAAGALALGLAAPAQGAGCGGEYTIQSGDTLSHVARQCDTSVEALMGANPQITSPARIAVGWKLRVPVEADDDGMAAMSEIMDSVSLTGRILNGRRCALIATPDGDEYGVISPELSFVSGRTVAVEGHIVNDPTCSGPRTLLVTDLRTTEL